jgi:DNA invertase Pin-like site-specific DNA recombinase
MTDAYSYLRFSSARQASGDSLRRQTKLAREYCDGNGLTLRDEFTYRDLGVSAYKSANAKTGRLGEFLDAVKEGKVRKGSYLLVESLDRISRAASHVAASLLTELVEADITVVTLLDEHVWNKQTIENTADFLYSVLLFARAHDESLHKSKRSKKLYEGRRDRGDKIICNVGPGWLVKDKEARCWQVDIERADSVKRVFSAYLAGQSAHSICQRANEEGWPLASMRSKRAKGWHVSLVRRILSNQAVTGLYAERTGKEHPEFFPRIISDEEFSRAQVTSHTRKAFPKRRDESRYNIFQGIIFCGYCGSTMGFRDHGAKAPHHAGETRRYFCTAHVRAATSTCKVRPGAKEVQEHLLAGVYRNIPTQVTTEEALAEASRGLEQATDTHAMVEARYTRLLQAVEFSDAPPQGLVQRLGAVEAELETARTRLREAKIRATALPEAPLDLELLEVIIGSAIADLDDSPESRDRLRVKLQRYVRKVFLYGREQIAAITFQGDSFARWCIVGPKGVLPPMPPPLPVALA